MARLHLYRDEASFDAALDAVARARPRGAVALELGRGITTVRRLLAEAAPARRAVSAAVEALAASAAADATVDLPALFPSQRAGLQRTIALLRRAGIGPTTMRQVAPRLPPGARRDTLMLATRLERYERLLGPRLDTAAAERLALQAIARAPLPSLVEIDTVDVHATAPFDVLTLLVIEALTARGLVVRCPVPEPQPGEGRWERNLAAAVERALDRLEAEGQGAVERVVVPLPMGPQPTLTIAPTPLLEVRAVARRVRDEVARGTPVDGITVAARPEQRAALEEALARYGVPVSAATDRAVGQTSLYRFVTSLHRLADEGAPREAMATLVASRLVEPLRVADRSVPGSRIAALLRQALAHSAAKWEPALESYVRARPPAARAEAAQMAAWVLGLRARITSLPFRAPLAQHVAALATLLETLGTPARLRRHGRGPVPDPASPSGRAQAAEQAALRLLEEALLELPRAAALLRLDDRTYTRADFAALLALLWSHRGLRRGGARGAAVTLCSFDELPDAPQTLLALVGVDDDALGAGGDEGLLHDETVVLLGRALGRPLFEPGDDLLRRRRLRLAAAMGRAGAVCLSMARTDDGGRATSAGELVERARALGAIEVAESGARVPRAEDARTTDELVARLLLEREGASSAREGLDAASETALAGQLGARLHGVSALARIERDREAYFAGERDGGAYDGRLGAAIAARLQPGGVGAPLSASTLETYADCPQRYFLDKIVRARPSDELDDELDERAGGQLAHALLEALFSRWRDEGLLPLRGRDAEEALIEPVLGEVVARWRAQQPVGDEVLFAHRQEVLKGVVRSLWRREADLASPLVPAHFELSFTAEVPAGEGLGPIHLHGKIDRIDLGGANEAALYDYKSGSLGPLKAKLDEDAFGDTSWQMPLYAAVAREQLGIADVQLLYYSLRELGTAETNAPVWLRLDAGEFVAKMRGQVARMRSGDFEVRPRADACQRCHFQAACRIVERQPDDAAEDAT